MSSIEYWKKWKILLGYINILLDIAGYGLLLILVPQAYSIILESVIAVLKIVVTSIIWAICYNVNIVLTFNISTS